MLTKRLFVGIWTLTVCGLPVIGNAQDGVLATPITIDEAIARHDASKLEAERLFAVAKAEYEASVAEATSQLVEVLKKMAKEKVAEGDLPEASKRWEAVLGVDIADKDAHAFFKTIKRLDVLRKYPGPKVDRILWVDKSDPNHKFVRTENGEWQELFKDGVAATFRELLRDKDVVELASVPERIFVRLHGTSYYHASKGERWTLGNPGRWLR
jgi:hypothetical protein